MRSLTYGGFFRQLQKEKRKNIQSWINWKLNWPQLTLKMTVQPRNARDQLENRCTGCSVTSVNSGTTCSASASSLTTSRRTRTLSANSARVCLEVEEGAARSPRMTPVPVTWILSELFSRDATKFLNPVYLNLIS